MQGLVTWALYRNLVYYHHTSIDKMVCTIIQGIQSQILRSTVPMRMGSGIVKMLRISVDVSTFEWPGSLMRSILAGVATLHFRV